MRVVVIDDSLAVQRSLGRQLEAMVGVQVVGYAVDVAGAKAVVEAERPDLVVLDVSLRHGERGMDVLRHLVREHPEIKVVAFSNFTWQAMRDGFLQAGASAYFDKSFEFTLALGWIAGQITTA